MKKSKINRNHLALINATVNNTFPDAEWLYVEPLRRGLSSSALYVINIAGTDYVVRLDDPKQPHNDLTREYHALEAASKQQIAPKVFYLDPESGVILMKFIKTCPLGPIDLIKQKQIKAFANLIQQLHTSCEFKTDISIFQRIDTLYKTMNEQLKNTPLITKSMALKNNLEKLLSDKNDLRACHCDIHPYNTLFDGDKFWLVDWNAASQQNFYFDLVCCTLFFYFYDEMARKQFLIDYFSRTLNTIEEKKLYLMEMFACIYFGMMFLYISGVQNGLLVTEQEIISLPTYAQFMKMIGDGTEKLDNPVTQQKFGFVFLKCAQEKFSDQEFLDSIELLNKN